MLHIWWYTILFVNVWWSMSKHSARRVHRVITEIAGSTHREHKKE